MRIAVVTFADDPEDRHAAGLQQARGDDALYGWFGIAAGYAMIAQRHKAEYGTPRGALGAVAVPPAATAPPIPHAQLRKPLTLDKYMGLAADGRAVLPRRLLPGVRRRRGGRGDERRACQASLACKQPVPILGFGQGQTSWDVPQRPVLTSTMAKAAGATAFKMAGLDAEGHRRRADLRLLHHRRADDARGLRLLQARARAAISSRAARIESGGELPINTSGGLLSETGMPGMQLVMEGVRQMRGDLGQSGARMPRPASVEPGRHHDTRTRR